MADEPSIDEILASLDRLLKEGEGRNDEPVESSPPDAGEAASSPSAHDAPSPHFFEVLDEEAEGSHGDVGPAGGVSDTDADGTEAADEGRASVSAGMPAGEGSGLFVLTDAMRVDDQPSLPLDMGGGTDEAEEAMRQALEIPEESGEPEADEPGLAAPESEAAGEVEPEIGMMSEFDMEPEIGMAPEFDMEPEPAFVPVSDEAPGDAVAPAPEQAWDEAELQALVDQVTDDVCSAMAEALPDMIRRALATRLPAFIDERIPYDGNTESQP